MYPRLQFGHLLSSTRAQLRCTKQPEAFDPARPTVLQLPEPVLEHIFSFLSDDYLGVVALLGSPVYHVARSVQHRELQIDLDDDENHALDRLNLVSRLGQLGAVRTLRVSAHKYHPGHHHTEAVLARLSAIVPGMTGLKDLHWHVDSRDSKDGDERMTPAIPAPILASLPANARLHTSIFCSRLEESHVHGRAFLEALIDNKNLHALSIRVAYAQQQMCLDTMRPLKRVFLSCPKLTRIPHMDIGYPLAAHIRYGWNVQSTPYCGLGFVNGERPQALEEFGSQYYPWGTEGLTQCVGFDGGGYKCEWDYWANVFDWSKLVRVNNHISTTLTSSLAPLMTGLKELVLKDIPWFDANFMDGITAPIELISITGCNCIDKPESIARFGATLRRLKIHHPGQWSHHLATVPSLEHLSETLPLLEHLSVDVAPVHGAQHEFNYGVLDAIAAFPSLRTVELWSPPGMAPPSGTPAPLLTPDAARHLFDYIHGRNDKIQRATFHSGERNLDTAVLSHQPISVWGPLAEDGEPQWNQLNAVTFECGIVYPVGEQGSRVYVTCPDFSLEMNLQLLQLQQQTNARLGDLKTLNPREVRIRAALVGPLSQADWKVWKTHYSAWLKVQKQKREENTVIAKLVTGPWRRALGG